MGFRFCLATAALLLAGAASAQMPADTQALVARHTHALELRDDGRLTGPGAELLRERTANAQFVLFGEAHHDRDTPRLAAAIYRMLHAAHGYATLVVEQDPLAIDSASTAPLRGDADAIAALARRYPMHFGFASDQDLELLAEAGLLGAIWGVEQAQGAARYLEELLALAPDAPRRTAVEALLAKAQAETRERPGIFMHDDATTLPQLQRLRGAFGNAAAPRALELLDALIDSARIYSYNRRASAGEYVGLYNNTEREALFKRNFIRRYRVAAGEGGAPKAMFKFGAWHMYRGKSPGQAYTLGNFAHEFALWNGMTAYGVYVLPLGGHGQWADVPAWLRPLLPAQPPDTAVLIDLQPLKPWMRPLREHVDAAEQWQLRDLLQGFDAIVILPHSARASWTRTGFTPP